MKYTDLIFDLYGTLVDIHTEENEAVWEKTALYFSFHGAAYRGSELKSCFERLLTEREAAAAQSYECYPDIPFEDIMAELFEMRGIVADTHAIGFNAAQLFRILSIEYLRLYPGVIAALTRLRSCGCRLWLLSNAQRVFTEYELCALGLDKLFDGIYISSAYGFRKPDTRFFHALIDERQLDISRCLMIGNDRNTDIAGAKTLGMDTLYMHTALTPPDQKAAESELVPGRCQNSPFEFEGDDWSRLCDILCTLIKE